ncbi:MAG TPA: sigma-70 family RNA polymerase sigma factor [Chitinophagaceae bacterium]|nr:sigma-70 family RNA polymerase sigma factor [Chitinophagaceae bacterium]
MSSVSTDMEVIARILKGDQQAYAELVGRYQHYVFTLALKYCQNREDAEEVAQDIFIKVYRSLADFKGTSKFSTWLYTITYNTSVTFLRKKKLNVSSMDDDRTFMQLESQESSFSANLVEQKTRVNRVNEAISQLSADDAQIITLFYKGDQTLEEIGRIMGMEPNTVKVRLHRARHKLKEKLEKEYKSEAI